MKGGIPKEHKLYFSENEIIGSKIQSNSHTKVVPIQIGFSYNVIFKILMLFFVVSELFLICLQTKS